MERKCFYHMYANGDDARDFIICEADFYTEFNLIAVCAYNSGVIIVAFSLEDTHPHFILFGTYEECLRFKKLFERSSKQHITSTRKSLDNVVLDCQIDEIDSDDYLKNVATYVISQATKDGKNIMPYDYTWGTGSMYFRPKNHISIWCRNTDGDICKPKRMGQLTYRERKPIKCSRMNVPDEWLTCNGVILPDNYVDVERYESIFRTHNCFRAFLSSGRSKDKDILDKMAHSRGVNMDYLEARKISEETCMTLFGKRTARWLETGQRLELARVLRKDHLMTYKQLSTVCRLPEEELRKYVK